MAIPQTFDWSRGPIGPTHFLLFAPLAGRIRPEPKRRVSKKKKEEEVLALLLLLQEQGE